jgi:hypothetical protein
MIATRSVLLAAVALFGQLAAALPARAADCIAATGTITLDGKPLASGKITLHREDGQFVGSQVKHGKYVIDCLPAGRFTVTFEGQEVPAKYGNENTSGLVVMVTTGDKVQFDFILSSR